MTQTIFLVSFYWDSRGLH